MINIPRYTIRYSKRAKYVRLSISKAKGLEVILPFKSSADCIPSLLKDKQKWINRHADLLTPISKPVLPEIIHLQAVNLRYQVLYTSKATAKIKVNVKQNTINVVGDVTNEPAVKKALINSLKNIAKTHFIAKANNLACQYSFNYQQIKIRAQKTRWGSCSSKKNINLNYKLLFMPSSYLHYVILHEFAHTKVMNHSKTFWQTLEKVLPNCKQHDKLMNNAHQYLPNWIENEFS